MAEIQPTMALDPTFTIEYLSSISTSKDISPATLIELLADLEAVAITQPWADPIDPELLSTYYSAFIFALLLVDDINEARFLSKRISSHLGDPKSTPPTSPSDLILYPLIPFAYRLLQAVYTQNYPSVYNILLTTPWDPSIQPLANRFLEHFRRKTFRSLSKAYTTITPSQAAVYLGFPGDDEQTVVEKLTTEGWIWDDDQGLLRPVFREEQEEEEREVNGVAGWPGMGENGKDLRIKRLTGLVTHLTEV